MTAGLEGGEYAEAAGSLGPRCPLTLRSNLRWIWSSVQKMLDMTTKRT